MKLHPILLLIPVLATLSLASCVAPSMSGRDYHGAQHQNHPQGSSQLGGYHNRILEREDP
ncbi:MAG: hypothetical protein NTY98_30415 [Verrucomicrobia bacterium]|nr:hypothetical protein [Verrucomicrobiota bacterium]